MCPFSFFFPSNEHSRPSTYTGVGDRTGDAGQDARGRRVHVTAGVGAEVTGVVSLGKAVGLPAKCEPHDCKRALI